MIVVDASVWISSYIANERDHHHSRRLLQAAGQSENIVAVPATLLPEIGGALTRRLNDSRFAIEVTNNLLSRRDILLFDVDQSLASSSAAFAAELRLRGYDAVYVALAWSLRVPLVTLDSDHLLRASERITVWTPEAALDAINR
ncbi:MAG: type II toxin-antitoxin system VapC family toxin [Thermomicrobiales bacterium]|nr:type II toxin-antitoxin system VapC family toxin [Thermomicrobiales bacterium]